MPDDQLPRWRVGHLSPQTVIENQPYEFYKLAPDGVMLVAVAVGLKQFSRQDVERVTAPIQALTAQLVERHVDIVVWGGVPLPVLIGLEAHAKVLDRIAEVAKVPVTSTVRCVVEAAKGLGLKKIAVANKWTDEMNATLADFFASGGTGVLGRSTRPMEPSEFNAMTAREGVDLAYELGRAALEAHPDADGLYIGGGAWLVLPASLRLEREFGKPVINNQNSLVWHVCRTLGCWRPKEGFGRLMAQA
ncbi:MAG: hypothetical protein KGN00_10600 [Chloroflexota bacterium]|nr:hypothetical protein [Chloroflexota bacterium]MDE3194128.1 hypothetical protein [Chloroflexota bacterium]